MLKFGPSGNDKAFYEAGNKSSTQAPSWLRGLGLSAYEYSFGQGVRIGADAATALGVESQKNKISISVHAPYYISFASPEPEKRENSFGYVLSSLEKLKLMHGERCVIHTAALGGQNREDVLSKCRESLTELAERMRAMGYGDLRVCPETMGKYTQIGTAEEIINFCTLDEVYIPCFDFGHINCYMQGKLDTDAYSRIIEYSFDRLGEEKTKNMHVHFSKIKYGERGELCHLDLSDTTYGPDFETFAHSIVKYGLTPTIICESAGVMAMDSQKMKKIYDKISG